MSTQAFEPISEADRIRREVIADVVKALLKGTPTDIDYIPSRIRPKGHPSSRCCIYKDRAALRYRTLCALGYRVEDETDEVRPISDYVNDLNTKPPRRDPFITIFPDACSACMETQIMVSNLCRGCLARPCTNVCLKKAIEVRNGKAFIEHNLCINCGKCAQVCRYHAIVQIPLACADACPVDAVHKTEDGRVTIDYDRCIRCGRCIQACPFAAIMQTNQVAHVLRTIQSGKRVVALVAPAINGMFPGNPGHLYAGLRRIGFHAVYEVAAGADETAKAEAHEWAERKAQGAPFMTTSCCPAWIQAVKRVLPEMAPYVSSTPTPMVFTDRMAKAAYPDAVTVFIGPCAAKRTEAFETGSPDYVITAEELIGWFMAYDLDLTKLEEEKPDAAGSQYGGEFAISGGVANALIHYLPEGFETPKVTRINGLTLKAINLLKIYAKTKKAPAELIEVMACEGGCAAGPCRVSTCLETVKKITSRRPDDFTPPQV